MSTNQRRPGQDRGNEAAPKHGIGKGAVLPEFETWKGSCLERLCGPNPSTEEQQNWYRWCQYHCTEHAVCKRKDPPGSF